MKGIAFFWRTLRYGGAARRGFAEPHSLAGSQKGFDYPLMSARKNRHPHEGDCGFLADPKGFEPLTFWSVARRSIQLS